MQEAAAQTEAVRVEKSWKFPNNSLEMKGEGTFRWLAPNPRRGVLACEERWCCKVREKSLEW